MSILCVSEKRERVIRELVEGKECATKLKYLLLQKPIVGDDEGVYVSAEALLAKVQRSFSETLSVLTSSMSEVVGDEIVAVASSNIDLISEEVSTESRKRSSRKDKRGSYKRRKTEFTWTNVSENIEDNHAWRKYGQKEILNSKFPRNYFRCTKKYDQGCRATKQVQMIEENPVKYQITYIGFHTCKGTLIKEAPKMVKCSDHTWDSIVYQEQDHAAIISTQTETQTTLKQETQTTVKQEYPNKEETKSDLTDNLDPSLWSDFNDDFELSKPSIGVFSSHHFCSTSFHFDHESHHLI